MLGGKTWFPQYFQLTQMASAPISPFAYLSINRTNQLVYLYLVENLSCYISYEKKKVAYCQIWRRGMLSKHSNTCFSISTIVDGLFWKLWPLPFPLDIQWYLIINDVIMSELRHITTTMWVWTWEVLIFDFLKSWLRWISLQVCSSSTICTAFSRHSGLKLFFFFCLFCLFCLMKKSCDYITKQPTFELLKFFYFFYMIHKWLWS